MNRVGAIIRCGRTAAPTINGMDGTAEAPASSLSSSIRSHTFSMQTVAILLCYSCVSSVLPIAYGIQFRSVRATQPSSDPMSRAFVEAEYTGVYVRSRQRPGARSIARHASADSVIPVLEEDRGIETLPENAEILSRDPLVYTIPDLLSADECQAFIDRSQMLQKEGREMKLSNPPDVSLDAKKLWPLPFLCIGAGVPSLVRVLQSSESIHAADGSDGGVAAATAAAVSATSPLVDRILSAVLPPVLIASALTAFMAFGVVLPVVRSRSNASSRTSVALALNLEEDLPYVRNLVDRVCRITRHPWGAWEAPVMTRYSPGAIFARHSDASPTRGSEWKDEGGQRIVTCICYLNTVHEGGETSFDRLGFAVAPVRGRALFFFPTVAGDSLEADDRLTHESLPVPRSSDEEKYIIQMFGRIGPRVPPPLGLPSMYAKTSTVTPTDTSTETSTETT